VETIDRETRDEKPFFGVWLGQFITAVNPAPETIESAKKLLEASAQSALKKSDAVEIRYPEWIIHPPNNYPSDPLNQHSSVGYKYVLWGRAFKIMRAMQGHTRRKRKMWLNGHRVKR